MGKFTHQPVKWDSFLSTFNVISFHTEREDLILGKSGIQGTKKPRQSLVFNEGTWFFFYVSHGGRMGRLDLYGGIPRNPQIAQLFSYLQVV